MSTDFFKNNLNKLIDDLPEGEMAILYSGDIVTYSSDSTYQFRVNKNFYYYTGIEIDGMYLMVYKTKFKSKMPSRVKSLKNLYKYSKTYVRVYFDFCSKEYEKWVGKRISLNEITTRLGISSSSVFPTSCLIQDAIKIKSEEQITKIYIEDVDGNKAFKEKFNNICKLTEDYAGISKIENVSVLTSTHREIKEDYEINMMKNAIKITEGAIKTIMRNIKDMKYEYEASSYFDFYLKRKNVNFKAFESIFASGANATVLHYIDNSDRLKKTDMLLMDVGAEYANYAADVSRTIPINGKFTKNQRKFYDIVLSVNKELIKEVKVGMTFKELNELACKKLSSKLIDIKFISNEKELKKYYFHSISHPLGLDAHDLRGNSLVIKDGMVITIEPGLYIPEEGIGIRIEDDIYLKDGKVIILTKNIPKEVDDIEDYMK